MLNDDMRAEFEIRRTIIDIFTGGDDLSSLFLQQFVWELYKPTHSPLRALLSKCLA